MSLDRLPHRFSGYLVPGLLLLTLGLGLVSRVRGSELFPFFSWSMFSVVPNWHTQYDLLIHELDGETFDPPLRLREAGRLSGATRSITNVFLITKFGWATQSNNLRDAVKYRRMLEENILRRGVRYELVEVSFNPLEMWREERSYSRSIAIFDMTTGERGVVVEKELFGEAVGPELALSRNAVGDSFFESPSQGGYKPLDGSRLKVVETAKVLGAEGEGTFCFRVAGRKAGGSGVWQDAARLRFESGQRYFVLFKVYSAEAPQRFRVGFKNEATEVWARDGSTSSEDLYSRRPKQWNDVVAVLEMPHERVSEGRLEIRHYTEGSSEWYLDDVSIRQIVTEASP